jgi:hypothetical protein
VVCIAGRCSTAGRRASIDRAGYVEQSRRMQGGALLPAAAE